MASNKITIPKRIYKSDTMHQRWLKAVEYLRTESKVGFIVDKQVERIDLPEAVYFQGNLVKIVSEK